jgi:hypothetical protein
MSKITVPDSWHDPDKEKLLHRFNPSATHDTTIIQLALNARGDASAWENARQQLESMLDAAELADLPKTWLGYTLTYQVVLALGIDADTALDKLQPSIRRLRSSESLQPLGAS